MKSHYPVLGIGLMTAGSLVGTCSDAVTKLLTERFAVTQILFGQSIVIVVVLVFGAPLLGWRRVFLLQSWRAQMLRALLHVATSFLFISGLAALSLSTVVTLWFANPLYTAALAPWLLHETGSRRRWALVTVGFLGVTLIANPSAGGISYLVVYPLSAALCGALRDVLTRRMTAVDSSESMILYSTIGMAIVGAMATRGDFGIAKMSLADVMLFFASGLTYLATIYLITESLRHAKASVVTPFKYSTLVWVIVLDMLVWRHLPAWNVMVGALVIIVAMLALFRAERESLVAT